jgi:hypothetical protein
MFRVEDGTVCSSETSMTYLTTKLHPTTVHSHRCDHDRNGEATSCQPQTDRVRQLIALSVAQN